MPQAGYISIFDEDGCVAAHAAGTFSGLAGMPRYDARAALQKDLEARGLFRGEKPNWGQVLPVCSRSGDVVEPRLVPQWWVRIDEMADQA
jgi:valyl-tRNA synthetase